MSNIEISTSHNIVVRFELASTTQRFLAWFIDIILLTIISLLVLTIAQNELVYWLFFFPLWTFYHFFWEVFNKGQSPGKMLLKIRVVTLKGRTPLVIDYFTRWIFRIIDIGFSLGTMAVIFIASSGKSQRIGDVLAQTSVVRSRNENEVSLDSIKKLDRKEGIKYPEIVQYSDEDMLLLKQSLLRYKQSPNEATKNVLISIADDITKRLKIKLKDKRILEFLDDVLYEYILLTR